ncbi:LytTR family transcriptional regulator DNA-binding domain-containing protein [Reichenbachiella sp. MALMAid0571]|uniref:LytTR family transcriptional regulator DNA-binding domain-containing protein n=1 Tax=Reichenbachiella sp. MALMAid0571 TaxID=3143939 RepID=UPI0032DFADC4
MNLVFSKIIFHIKPDLEKWLVTLLTGLFLFVVLYVYRAYNIDQIPAYSGHGLFFRAVAYAAATSVLFYLFEFHVCPFFGVNTIKKRILWTTGIVVVGINISFLLYNYFWNWAELRWSSYGKFYYEYPLIVIFPIVIARLIGNKTKQPDNHILFTSENEKKHFSIKPEHLLYLQSFDNYVEIHYTANGEVKKQLLRTSLKHIEQKHLPNPCLVRCHRSYIVNPNNIDCIVKGNKMIQLRIKDIEIPVSNKYSSNFI